MATFVRTKFEEYCKLEGIRKLNYSEERTYSKKKWYTAEYDGKYRGRTICRIWNGEQELTLDVVRKAGYYLILKKDNHRIFEELPRTLVTSVMS